MNFNLLQRVINSTLYGINKPKLKRVWSKEKKKYVYVDKKGKEVEGKEEEVTIVSPIYSPTEEKGND